jgi:hypothetical protein
MQPLSASELLRVWEEGQGEPPYRQALLLLAAACPGESPEAILSLSIGSRDSRLLTLREWTFGPELTSLTACPVCGERLEFSLNVSDIRVSAPDTRSPGLHLALDDYSLDFRLPNTGDLIEAGRISEIEQIQRVLIERCVRDARRKDEPMTAERLPPQIVEALASRMAEADPQADTRLALSCPVCGHRWQALFDIVSFFWGEIQAWVLRILREVHLLASAYGWHEADILAMSTMRRRIYLGMVAV